MAIKHKHMSETVDDMTTGWRRILIGSGFFCLSVMMLWWWYCAIRACHKGKSLVNPEFNEEQEVVVRGIGKIGSSVQPFVRNDLRIDDIVNNPFGIKARCRP